MTEYKEHLEWCKQRALQYIDTGDLDGAFLSMMSDLRKHEETEGHSAIQLGVMLKLGGSLNSSHEMREFIIGFN